MKDKFGAPWHSSEILYKIMSDPAKAAQAFMTMQKSHIEQIVQASIC